MGAGRKHQSYCGSKSFILERLGARDDPNASIAFDEMVKDSLLEQYDGKYVKNFDKRTEFDVLVREESEEELAMVQPQTKQFAGLVHRFTKGSEHEGSNQRIHYYCVLEKDHNSWVVLIRTKAGRDAGRKKLGSFVIATDRISRLWAAAKQAAEKNGGRFIRFDIEKIDLGAAGTDREYSRAALNIFKELGFIKAVDRRRNAEVYELTGREPNKANLDRYENAPEQKA